MLIVVVPVRTYWHLSSGHGVHRRPRDNNERQQPPIIHQPRQRGDSFKYPADRGPSDCASRGGPHCCRCLNVQELGMPALCMRCLFGCWFVCLCWMLIPVVMVMWVARVLVLVLVFVLDLSSQCSYVHSGQLSFRCLSRLFVPDTPPLQSPPGSLRLCPCKSILTGLCGTAVTPPPRAFPLPCLCLPLYRYNYLPSGGTDCNSDFPKADQVSQPADGGANRRPGDVHQALRREARPGQQDERGVHDGPQGDRRTRCAGGWMGR